MRAGLGGHVEAGGAHELDAARRRDMADVQAHACDAGELEAARDRLVLGDRRTRASMRERVQSLGGDLTLESQPGTGTRVIVAIPLKSRAGVSKNGPLAPVAG